MQMLFDLDLFSGKTSPACCPTNPTPSAASLPRWLDAMLPLCPVESDGQTRVLSLDRNDKSLTVYAMPSSTEFHREGEEYSYLRPTLAEILETGPVPACYFLSPEARAGILTRAERRGKKLPPMLAAVLAQGVSQK